MVETAPTEQEIFEVETFFDKIASTGKVPKIDRDVLVRVFDNFGVNIGDMTKEGLESLKKPDLKSSFLGIREIWGDDRLDDFDVFLAEFIKNYNQQNERRLSRSKDSHSGESGLGMRRFLMYTTQLISGDIDFDDYVSRVENSCQNEVLWQLRQEDKRVTETGKTGKQLPVPMMPANYVGEFWNWVKKSSKTSVYA